MLSEEKLLERLNELTQQFELKAQQRTNLQNNIQQFQQKLSETNTELLVLDAKRTEVSELINTAQQAPRENSALGICEDA